MAKKQAQTAAAVGSRTELRIVARSPESVKVYCGDEKIKKLIEADAEAEGMSSVSAYFMKLWRADHKRKTSSSAE